MYDSIYRVDFPPIFGQIITELISPFTFPPPDIRIRWRSIISFSCVTLGLNYRGLLRFP